jgi:hypothetical protein
MYAKGLEWYGQAARTNLPYTARLIGANRLRPSFLRPEKRIRGGLLHPQGYLVLV